MGLLTDCCMVSSEAPLGWNRPCECRNGDARARIGVFGCSVSFLRPASFREALREGGMTSVETWYGALPVDGLVYAQPFLVVVVMSRLGNDGVAQQDKQQVTGMQCDELLERQWRRRWCSKEKEWWSQQRCGEAF